MMSSNNPVDMLGVVAKVLEKLPQQVVFTGGLGWNERIWIIWLWLFCLGKKVYQVEAQCY